MIQKLKTLSLFKNIDDSLLGIVQNFSKIKFYPKDFILFYEGDILDHVLFLLSGSINIYKFDRFGNKKYLYSIYASKEDKDDFLAINDIGFTQLETFGNACVYENSEVLSIDYKKLIDLAKQNNDLFLNLSQQIVCKNAVLNEIIMRDIVFDAIAKLAYMLDKNLYRFNFIQRQEVAYRLNIQPETLSRILKKLKTDGIIETNENGSVCIIDKNRLQEIYKI
ncbi:Crp/Fnr family transcriptional regulator [Helicobacter sp. 11S03491-1]|uniref:Crp/Fnr family transcriptional regulator n=1 Tax=Helicobacter sp. 11S03491-1 TaxID=1476196 RepID=UPI000BA54C67|nr:Crp/Fnr family transcriptional regulator [Helicobacter sp. 11S03491-1]PAF41671.1 hypothetical protein BKH45_06155 [Helicobacter sp. 11S03491-1]